MQAIDCHTLHQWQQEEKCLLVDVRSAEEHRQAHIEGCLHIPLEFIPQDLPVTDKTIVFYCKSGKRSKAACKLANSYEGDHWSLLGGIDEWKNDYPTKSD
jgi:rhodanese-related sulfurtransferase